ncbi:MAG: hypothetical protein SVW77_03120 [Candidatus Nanohaloarchaea archaeon]|nr:hypothetical protein [Candidatus Nanohaloarchaea archaeon]
MDPDTVVRRIEDVEIQGATAVAEAGIELLKAMDEEGRSKDELEETRQALRSARPTEPLLFNCLDASRENGYDAVLDHIRTARDAIAEIGAPIVEDNDVIYTHCHSSTVTAVLTEAYEETSFEVRVTETRPLYQGRETAGELAEGGIPVQLYVDSGVRLALKEADHMFIGADAVTHDGAVVNKVGSGLFAATASRHDVPVYVFADAWKLTEEVDIEERDPDEVWDDRPGGVTVANPAFETITPGNVDGIVSELGVHEPNAFMDAARDAYPEVGT